MLFVKKRLRLPLNGALDTYTYILIYILEGEIGAIKMNMGRKIGGYYPVLLTRIAYVKVTKFPRLEGSANFVSLISFGSALSSLGGIYNTYTFIKPVS